jgi:hypothetical protein
MFGPQFNDEWSELLAALTLEPMLTHQIRLLGHDQVQDVHAQQLIRAVS